MAAEQARSEREESAGQSSDGELDDLNILNFPPDVDWSSTLVLRCDPAKAPYRLVDLYRDLHPVLIRNNVFSLGPTVLNYAFTLSFKSTRATESFVKFLKGRRNRDIVVKGSSVTVSRVPSKCVTVSVRWIPMEIDSALVLEVLRKYGSVVKTEAVQSNMRGWFHVYTNERKFTIHLHKDVDPEQLPFGIYVKGLLGAVHVFERKPPCLQCYYDGHNGNICKYEGCPLFVAH